MSYNYVVKTVIKHGEEWTITFMEKSDYNSVDEYQKTMEDEYGEELLEFTVYKYAHTRKREYD